ncbi:hypothetical protein [Spongorhabdus nitratireducens]
MRFILHGLDWIGIRIADKKLQTMKYNNIRRLYYLAVFLLMAVSVPWYRTPGQETELIRGFPDWVVIAFGCYFTIATLNMLLWFFSRTER